MISSDFPRGHDWTPSGWRGLPNDQPIHWPDQSRLSDACARLATKPPLIFAGEARSLRDALARVRRREAFVLQAGDCAESFEELSAENVRDMLKIILQMAVVLSFGAGVPVVQIGRMAGQYGKPRTSATEMLNGESIPVFRGHIVNQEALELSARAPNPERLLTAYNHAAVTLNLIRAFTTGGFARLQEVHNWNTEFVRRTHIGERFEQLANELDRTMRFISACGADSPVFREVQFWTSHEALLLEYEEALTRVDSLSGLWYDCSAHMVWLGDRTRRLDGAHVAFLAGINNPIGIKLSGSASPTEVVQLCQQLDRDRVPGRLCLISRMGAAHVEAKLPPIIEAVEGAGFPVVWICDPMHGNTFVSDAGYKTRRFADVFLETQRFFAIHRRLNTWPGGLHLELTPDAVTECIGGLAEEPTDQSLRYSTLCDPRLNGRQALELAFSVTAELHRTA